MKPIERRIAKLETEIPQREHRIRVVERIIVNPMSGCVVSLSETPILYADEQEL